MSKFEFQGKWPSEARASAEPAFSGLEWLVPGWCQAVTIRWNPTPDEGNTTATAASNVNFAYRCARIEIFPCFLTDFEERRLTVIHELLHISIQPLAEYACDLADRLLKEDSPKFHESVCDEIRVRNEGAVEDLAHAILGRERRIEAKSTTGPWAEPVRP